MAVYRPVRIDGLPERAKRRIGEPVVEVVVHLSEHTLDPPLGFACFEDGEAVLAGPDDLEGWDRSFTIARPSGQPRR